MNEDTVSKGYGPTKKAAKTAAVHILLQLICPTIYKEWQDKIAALQPEAQNIKNLEQNAINKNPNNCLQNDSA